MCVWPMQGHHSQTVDDALNELEAAGEIELFGPSKAGIRWAK